MHQALLQEGRVAAITHKMMHKSVWGDQEGGRKLELTWLESPVQFSGMSQSFTASLHTTPINSICRSAQWKTNGRVYRIWCNRDAKCCVPGNRCSRGRCYTWSLGSACTSYSRPRPLGHTPKKQTNVRVRKWLLITWNLPTVKLTTGLPQSHSSPCSTKPFPHTGGSKNCERQVMRVII